MRDLNDIGAGCHVGSRAWNEWSDPMCYSWTAMALPTGKPKSVTPPDGSRKMPRIARIAQNLGRMIPAEELDRIPKDLSSQIDHYVYGTPKK